MTFWEVGHTRGLETRLGRSRPPRGSSLRLHHLSPGCPTSRGARGSGSELFPVHSGGWHVFPAKQDRPRPLRGQCRPRGVPGGGPTSSHASVLVLTFGTAPAGGLRGSSQATWRLLPRWAGSPTSLLTDVLVFQKKGETTIKDRRKEQIGVSFPEFKKQCVWLGHHELTEWDGDVAPKSGGKESVAVGRSPLT